MYKVILFDFDGVILDSMPVRDFGFREIFKEYKTEDVEKLIKYHTINGGLSRYVKIRYFFEEILNEAISDSEVTKFAEKFSKIMKSELTKKEYLINDTVNFIQESYKSIILHIVSGSDQEELRYLCKELGISNYFKSIHGSPTKKNDLVKMLINDNAYKNDEVCLVGDSINDYDAAVVNNITFYGYNNIELKECGNYLNDFKLFTENKKI